jgi:hypothetical protein
LETETRQAGRKRAGSFVSSLLVLFEENEYNIEGEEFTLGKHYTARG